MGHILALFSTASAQQTATPGTPTQTATSADPLLTSSNLKLKITGIYVDYIDVAPDVI